MLGIVVVAVTWLVTGGADPPVAGPVRWNDMAFEWAGGPVLALESGTGAWYAAVIELVAPFTLDVRARLHTDSDPGAAWGIWLGGRDGSRVIYAIGDATAGTGVGYVTTRRCPPGRLPPVIIEHCPALRPEWRWMPYPRVKPPGEANTITLHYESSGAIRLRLNGERLGAAPIAISEAWGVWVRGGRESGAVLEWECAILRGKE